jgi:hypothetical protein
MPIVRLRNSRRPTLPRLGKLRKGGAKPASGFGKDLTYFRFTAEGERPEVQAAFEAAYGKEPAMLRVYLPYATPDANFDAWQEAWAGGAKLLHRCDGEHMVRWLGDDGQYVNDPEMLQHKPCPFVNDRKNKNACKPIGRLSVILPELLEAGLVGLVTLETHSINDIAHIDAVLRDVASRSTSDKGLQGIEFVIRRQKEAIVRVMEDGKRASLDKWLVKIEPTSEWLLAQLHQAQAEQMGTLPEEARTPEGADWEDEAEEEERPANAWLQDKTLLGQVIGKAKDLGLDKDELLKRLGVSRLGEITYDLAEAMRRVGTPVEENAAPAQAELGAEEELEAEPEAARDPDEVPW